MNQIGDSPKGETRYRAADSTIYVIVKRPTPRMGGAERWHWFEEGGKMVKDGTGHQTEAACVEDLIKYGRLTGRV